jgi:hypothetical protein
MERNGYAAVYSEKTIFMKHCVSEYVVGHLSALQADVSMATVGEKMAT